MASPKSRRSKAEGPEIVKQGRSRANAHMRVFITPAWSFAGLNSVGHGMRSPYRLLAPLTRLFCWRNSHEMDGFTGNSRVDSCGMYQQGRRGGAAQRIGAGEGIGSVWSEA